MGRIVTFAQQKGGAGKTTVLAHLAVTFAREGSRVALVDLDPQRSLARWAEMRDDPALRVVQSKDYRAGADLKAAARDHDLVLVDCPGAASTLLDAALRESDLVITPCQPSAMDVWATQSVLEAATRQRTPVRVVLNRMPPRASDIADVLAALDAVGAEVLEARLGNRVAFAQAMRSGRTAVETARRSPAATETEALAAEIAALLDASGADPHRRGASTG